MEKIGAVGGIPIASGPYRRRLTYEDYVEGLPRPKDMYTKQRKPWDFDEDDSEEAEE